MIPLKNNIAEYLKKRDWEWITEQQIISATGCTKEDLEALMQDPTYKRIIETISTDGTTEYRYISNKASAILLAVLHLKDRYPRWCTGTEISKATDGPILSSMLFHYVGIAPIERRVAYEHRVRVVQYRYIPNDKRSLLDRKFQGYTRPESQLKKDVYSTIQENPREWVTAKQIGCKMHVSGRYLSSVLMQLVRENKIAYKCDASNGLHCYMGVTA